MTFRDCYRDGIENVMLRSVVESSYWRHFWNLLLALYCVLQFLNYEVESRDVNDANVIDTITSVMLFSFVLEVAVSMLAIGVVGLWKRSAFDRIDIVSSFPITRTVHSNNKLEQQLEHHYRYWYSPERSVRLSECHLILKVP